MTAQRRVRKRMTSQEAAASREPAGIVRVLKSIYRPVPLMIVAGWLALLTLTPYVARWLPDLQQRDEYRLPLREIRVTAPARWVPGDLVEEIAVRSSLDDPLPLLDPQLPERVARAFAQHAWIDEVRSVRISPRDGVVVDVEYRTPVLMAQTKRGVYPVDRDGVLLPPDDFTTSDTQQFPLLINAPTVPQGPAGTPWGDPAIAGAARLAEVLVPRQRMSEYWAAFGLRAIAIVPPTDASTPQDAALYELLTDSGTRILWGHAPDDDVLEPSPAQKLDRLRRILETHGGFDRPYGPCRLDIRHWDEITQEPLRILHR